MRPLDLAVPSGNHDGQRGTMISLESLPPMSPKMEPGCCHPTTNWPAILRPRQAVA